MGLFILLLPSSLGNFYRTFFCCHVFLGGVLSIFLILVVHVESTASLYLGGIFFIMLKI